MLSVGTGSLSVRESLEPRFQKSRYYDYPLLGETSQLGRGPARPHSCTLLQKRSPSSEEKTIGCRFWKLPTGPGYNLLQLSVNIQFSTLASVWSPFADTPRCILLTCSLAKMAPSLTLGPGIAAPCRNRPEPVIGYSRLYFNISTPWFRRPPLCSLAKIAPGHLPSYLVQ